MEALPSYLFAFIAVCLMRSALAVECPACIKIGFKNTCDKPLIATMKHGDGYYTGVEAKSWNLHVSFMAKNCSNSILCDSGSGNYALAVESPAFVKIEFKNICDNKPRIVTCKHGDDRCITVETTMNVLFLEVYSMAKNRSSSIFCDPESKFDLCKTLNTNTYSSCSVNCSKPTKSSIAATAPGITSSLGGILLASILNVF